MKIIFFVLMMISLSVLAKGKFEHCIDRFTFKKDIQRCANEVKDSYYHNLVLNYCFTLPFESNIYDCLKVAKNKLFDNTTLTKCIKGSSIFVLDCFKKEGVYHTKEKFYENYR